MAQTTGGISQGVFTVEVSTDGSAWTDISGQATTVNLSGGDQIVGAQNTAEGSAPVVTNSNKLEALTVEVNFLYTETSGEAFRVVKVRFDGTDKTIFFRYTPKGNVTANKRYTATNDANTAVKVPIVSCLPPSTDAGSGDPAMAAFTLSVPKLFESAVP
jgi:hypothetical protein